jgi:phosphoribosylglycinamide formyltransferase-1
MRPSIRLGVIGSSGGAALAAANTCLKAAANNVEWVVVTDRECGLESWAKENGYVAHRVIYDNADKFSVEVEKIFHDAGCEDILLFYTRRITAPLIDKKKIWNIHPSLLPAFRGLNGVKDAVTAGVRVIGATLHRVDEGLDTGEIVAQVAAPIPSGISIKEAEHISYIQKVWLTLVWLEVIKMPNKLTDINMIGNELAIASPRLSNDVLHSSFADFLLGDNKKSFE